MKQKLLSSVLFAVVVLFLSSSAWAVSVTYTIPDNWIYFPGYSATSHNDQDQWGTPGVGNMYVTINDGVLEKVQIEVTARRVWDTLFINTSSTWNPADPDNYAGTGWDEWDYIVRDTSGGDESLTTPASSLADGLYQVNNPSSYIYTTVTYDGGRKGHPNGIEDGDLTAISVPDFNSFVTYDGSMLTYNFLAQNVTITLGEHPFFAYTPWCSNDVTGGSPVPEPATIILMGLGLIGLAGTIRKKIAK